MRVVRETKQCATYPRPPCTSRAFSAATTCTVGLADLAGESRCSSNPDTTHRRQGVHHPTADQAATNTVLFQVYCKNLASHRDLITMSLFYKQIPSKPDHVRRSKPKSYCTGLILNSSQCSPRNWIALLHSVKRVC